MRASGPRSQACSAPAVDLMAIATTAWRPRRAVDCSGPRAAGPLPRRQARAPGDAGQRPALPRVFRPGRRPHGHCDDGMETAPSGRLFRTAGRWPASAPPGAGSRGCGPAARAPRGVPPRPSTSWPLRRRHGDRVERSIVPDRGPLARFRAATRGLPGMRASGPRSQGCSAPAVDLFRRPLRRRHGDRAERSIVPDRGPLARFRAARRGLPGMRASGPRSQACSAPAVDLMATATTAWRPRRAVDCSGPRAAGPLPRRQARAPGDAGQRPALPRVFRPGRRPHGHCDDGMETASSGRLFRTAGRWPASAPPGAAPGDAGQRPALPGVFRPGRRPHGHCDDGMETAPSGRLFRTAGRWPASAPPGAAPGDAGQRPALPSVFRPSRRPHGHCDDGMETAPSGRSFRTAGRWPASAPPGAAPGDAGQRPALPGVFRPGRRPHGHCDDGMETAPSGRLFRTAGRWPASAPPGAGSRGCGPAARAPKRVPPRPSTSWPLRRRHGDRVERSIVPDRGPLARFRAARRGSRGCGPAARAPRGVPPRPSTSWPLRRRHGDRAERSIVPDRGPLARFRAARRGSRGCGPAARAPRGVPPRPSTSWPLRRRHGDRVERSSVPDRGPLARFRAARRGLPGMRASGPRSQGCSAPAVDLMATATTAWRPRRAVDCSAGRWPASAPPGRRGLPGMRASGPRSQGCSAPAVDLMAIATTAWRPRRAVDCSGPRAAGPLPRRQARAPGDAGQRPALPGLYPVSSDAGRTVGCSVGAPTPPTSDTRTWRRLGSVEHQSTPSTAGSRSNAMPYLSNTSSRIRTAKSKTCVPVAPPWLTSTSGCRGHT